MRGSAPHPVEGAIDKEHRDGKKGRSQRQACRKENRSRSQARGQESRARSQAGRKKGRSREETGYPGQVGAARFRSGTSKPRENMAFFHPGLQQAKLICMVLIMSFRSWNGQDYSRFRNGLTRRRQVWMRFFIFHRWCSRRIMPLTLTSKG